MSIDCTPITPPPDVRKTLRVKSTVRGVDLLLSSTGTSLTASLFKGSTSLAYRSGSIARTDIEIERESACLWVDGAAFDVSLTEVKTIIATFGISERTK
ncbi:hypothetical protein ACIPF8_19140 [Collimonas sp. NPDC087041]|uniref:hypothetical protein n=1 Tax=Collimonas sp. NPDC087041 TaxID=3363960 RepID=UPI0038003DE2